MCPFQKKCRPENPQHLSQIELPIAVEPPETRIGNAKDLVADSTAARLAPICFKTQRRHATCGKRYFHSRELVFARRGRCQVEEENKYVDDDASPYSLPSKSSCIFEKENVLWAHENTEIIFEEASGKRETIFWVMLVGPTSRARGQMKKLGKEIARVARNFLASSAFLCGYYGPPQIATLHRIFPSHGRFSTVWLQSKDR